MKPHAARTYVRNMITTFVVLIAFVATLIAAIPARAATSLLDVAYSSGNNIWTQRSDGTKTQLTFTGDQWDQHLDVSPDGLHIAFSRLPPGEPNATLWVIGVDGSALHQVSALGSTVAYPSYLHDRSPRWSPDGKRLSFEREVVLYTDTWSVISATIDIYTLDLATGTETSVTGAHHWAVGPAAWSPDGTRLVYWGNDIDRLKVIGVDGSADHPLSTQSPSTPTDPVWSADGNTIYFNTGDSVYGILDYTSIDQFTSVLSAPANNFTTNLDVYPRFGPDGRSLWFLRIGDRGSLTGISLVDGSLLTQPLTGIDAFSFIPAKAPTNNPAFEVKVDSSAVGNVFGSVPTIKVLESKVLPYPSAACGGGWEVSTTNKTDLALHIPTNGNVTGTRVDYGKVTGGYLLPGGTALYCVDFTRLNQIFSVLYDVNDAYARTMDAGLLLLNAVSLPAGASPELLNFEIAIASIPEISQLGACITSRNPSCAATTVRKLLADQQSMKALNEALIQYGVDTGITLVEQSLDKLIQKKLSNVVATGLFVIRYGGQSFLSTAGYVSFETAPLP